MKTHRWTAALAFATALLLPDSPAAQMTACSVVLAECGGGGFLIDSCDQPGTHALYNPCMTQQCSGNPGICLPGFQVANGTPCDDAYAASAPTPHGACTSSSLLNLNPWPNYQSCVPTPGSTSSPDCPQSHKCLCPGGVCRCVCNDGCGVNCNDVCVGGVCTRDILGLAEPTPIHLASSSSIEWTATPGATHWNTYRGTIPAGLLGSLLPGGVYGQTCFESANALGDGPTVSTDGSIPAVGTAFYYLVTAEKGSCETTPGTDSSGAPIPNLLPCPTPP